MKKRKNDNEELEKLLSCCEDDLSDQKEYWSRQSIEDEEKDIKKTSDDDTKTNNDLSVEDLLDEYYNARRFGDFINLLFGKKDSKKTCEEETRAIKDLRELSIEDMFDEYYIPYFR